MSIHETLMHASLFAAPRRRAADAQGSGDEGTLWRYVSELTYFIGETGQAYQFEDYFKARAPTPSRSVSTSLDPSGEAASRRAMDLLLKTLDETPEPEQQELAVVLIHLLNFIADTGQTAAFEDYFKNRLEYAPLAVARFATHSEAEAWLTSLAEPPSPARILIGDEYHRVWYSREEGTREIIRERVIEPYIEELTVGGIPPTVPSFGTRAEAEAWLTSHPAAPFSFVSIAGEHHLAVHHKRLKCHTLHPVALALKEWEEEKARFNQP